MQTNFHTKYKVECKIGEGSFSEVLKCLERSSGKFVAAKQLKKHFKSLNHASDIPELLVQQKVSKHPNLLELLDSYYDASKGKITLVFELMDMSLYDFMKTRKRPVPESRAKKYLFQIVKGIDHLHYHGIFHRDIKPENILVKGDQVKISDMGSIKGVYSKQPYTEYISTRWYRSPECLLTKGFYGPKMDIWAIGCVYFELLTLKPLFPGSDELDQITKVNHVLGTPSVKLINKLKKMKCRNMVPSFPHKKGTGLNSVLPMITDEGREIFKQMMVYDPDSRINVRRLLEHKYFNDMRHEEILSQRIITNQSLVGSRSKVATGPMWLSFITATRKRRIKRKPAKSFVAKKSSIVKTQSNVTKGGSEVSSEMSYSHSDDTKETHQIYSMRPSATNVESEDDNCMDDVIIHYDEQDKIPGYELCSKTKVTQSSKGTTKHTASPIYLPKANVSRYFPNGKQKHFDSFESECTDNNLTNRKGLQDQIINLGNKSNQDNHTLCIPMAVRMNSCPKFQDRSTENRIFGMKSQLATKSFQKRRHSYVPRLPEV